MTKPGPERVCSRAPRSIDSWRNSLGAPPALSLRLGRLRACPEPTLVLAERAVTCRGGGGARAQLPRRLRAAGYGAGPAGKCGRVFPRLRHQPGLGPAPGPPGHGLPQGAGRRPHLQSLGRRRRGDGRYGSRPGRRGVACEDGPRDRGDPRRRGQLSAERVPAPAALDGPPGCAEGRGPRAGAAGEEKAEGKESLRLGGPRMRSPEEPWCGKDAGTRLGGV